MPRRTRLRTEKRLAALEAYLEATGAPKGPPWIMPEYYLPIILDVLDGVFGRPAVEELVADHLAAIEAGGTALHAPVG